jgi:hypothetical protein
MDRPIFSLTVKVFNPFHGLGVGNLSKVALGGREIRMPQDHLADDFDGNAGTRGIGGSIAAEIVWPEGNADHFTSLGHDHPGSLIGNRKNPVLAGLASLSGIFPEPVGNFLRNEHHLTLPAAFRFYQMGIPDEAGHPFRSKAATDSDRFRPPIPTQGGHPVIRISRS